MYGEKMWPASETTEMYEMSVILSEFTVLRRLRVSKHSHDISELPEWILGTSVT